MLKGIIRKHSFLKNFRLKIKNFNYGLKKMNSKILLCNFKFVKLIKIENFANKILLI